MTTPYAYDPILAVRDLRKEKDGFPWLFLMAAVMVFGFSLFMYAWQFQFPVTDLHVHAVIAGEFDFSDLHTITSRLAYPVWHLCVAVLFQLGIPLFMASAIVCAAAKTLSFWLVWLLLRVMTQGQILRSLVTIAAFILMLVTGLRIPSVSDVVYKGIGSPNVWHNPTQIMVIVSMLLCLPYLVHCWYTFERLEPLHQEKTMLPWHMVAILAVLGMFSLACKPTFMQALIPAAAIFFLIQWIRHPKNSRYFGQLILAFLPSVLYFLLQYLYYTGVLVPFSSGVEIGITAESVLSAIRNMLIMAAFPLFALLCCPRKELARDKMLTLTLIMMVMSLLQAMLFHETGLRWGHGNFSWASMSVALLLWVLMTGHFLRSFALFCKGGQKTWGRGAAYGVGFGLLLWHVYSGLYYIFYLFHTNNSF